VTLQAQRETTARTHPRGSIRPRGTPQCQHPVESEAIHRLRYAGLLDLARHRTQSERIERDRGRRSQECQVAEPGAQLEIAYRQITLDLLLGDQPCDRGLLVAELIDQLEVDRLAAGEDPSATFSSSASSMPRRSFTRPRNQA
jgi:hypothetical protein